MNKFIKLLIESVDDEDFFSDLGYDTGKEVTFLVDNNIGIKNLGSNPTLKDIENIDHIGAILSNDNGYWILWNLNNEYWDPYGNDNSIPTEEFGKIVAVCVGKGMFAKVGWSGLINEYRWANGDEDDVIDITMHEINIDGSGYDSTMNIINNYREHIRGTIWRHLVKESTNDYQLYLPNIIELDTIYDNIGNKEYKNTNIYNLLRISTNIYWSSSLFGAVGYHYYSCVVYFSYGGTHYVLKGNTHHSVALLHF